MSGAKLAAGTTDEPRLYVGQPEIIGPAITADRNRMAAAVVSAIDQQATHTSFMSANVILVGRSMPDDWRSGPLGIGLCQGAREPGPA